MKTILAWVGAWWYVAIMARIAAADGPGFVEAFVLAEDREAVLARLVPGTEEHYFFHALHWQNTGQAPRLAEVLEAWGKRFPESLLRREILNREALLAHGQDPRKTMAYLRDQLRPHLEHVQVLPDRPPELPSVLDASRISREAYLGRVLAADDLGGASEQVLEEIVREKRPLRPSQWRALLQRIRWPSIPGLVELVAEDLLAEGSRGFGEFEVHRMLLPGQLDRLRELAPVVATQDAYVHERIRRLAPGADADRDMDLGEREAWLGRVWDSVQGLPQRFNSLKAHVLHGRLQLDRQRGVWDRARFVEYLKLPRPLPHVSRRLLQGTEGGRHLVDVTAGFGDLGLGLPPVANEEPFVREFFLHFAADDEAWEPWTEWLRDTWVKPVFAEAKITSGKGDPEKWASMLEPSAYQALRDRVDIELSPTNPAFVVPGADVSVKVHLKNTARLLVRVHEINTLGYYLAQGRQLNTDLPVDGLVANIEQSHEGESSPFRRVERTFAFPELKGRRGAWLVEFIGGGRSSRALLRSGQYTALQQPGAGGVELLVLDEARKPVTNAVAWLDGRRMAAHETGRIQVPFTATPGRRPVVLSNPDGSFASLTSFDHAGESYELDARFHVDREQLLSGREAMLVVRPIVRLNGEQVASGLLEEATLQIRSTTHDGIASTLERPAAGLGESGVHTQAFRVPDRLATLSVTLSGKVAHLTAGGEKRALSASKEWRVNGSDPTPSVMAVHFVRHAGGHSLEVLGRNGEAMPDQVVELQVRRLGYDATETIAVRTDAEGRVGLGSLEGVDLVVAGLTSGAPAAELAPEVARRNWLPSWHLMAGQALELPWDGDLKDGDLSLLELRAGRPVADRSGAATLADGAVAIGGLAPGDYRLRVRQGGVREMDVRVAAGVGVGRWIVGESRRLEAVQVRPVVATVSVDTNRLAVQVRNATPRTRVHVVAGRFRPPWSLFTSLAGGMRGGEVAVPERLPNLYSGGREIGDEHRYILDRRYAPKFPGNMLARPGLILNPWDKRETEGAATTANAGFEAPPTRGELAAAKMAAAMMDAGLRATAGTDPNIDFLAEASPAWWNLVPDAQGRVQLPGSALGDRQLVQVLVEDGDQAAWSAHVVPGQVTRLRDLRLARTLDVAGGAVERQQVDLVSKGTVLTMPAAAGAAIEVYDTLASIHAMFLSVRPDPTLAQFGFVTRWPSLSAEEKRARYSEFACHELNLFLERKDPAFFAEVVRPYLANKRDKTFMDEYLLGLDLRRHLGPWAHGRLNMAERALLGRRIPGQREAGARHLFEQWQLLPPDPEEARRMFEFALRGRAMAGRAGGGERGLMEFDQAAASDQPAVMMDAAVPAAPPGGAGALNGMMGRPAEPETLRRRGFAKADLSLSKDKRSGPQNGPVPNLDMLDAKPQGDALRFGIQQEALDRLEIGRVLERRKNALAEAYHRSMGPTREWAENNYHRLPIEQQDASLVPINGFWKDLAAWDGSGAFLSTNVAQATRHVTEMLLVLAVLDLPFETPRHETKVEGGQLTFTAGGPAIVFRKEVQPLPAAQQGGLLVSESFFRADAPKRLEGNEMVDAFVTGEFQSGVVYGARVVVGNPGSSPIRADVLTQVPKGALPVAGSRMTHGRPLRLEPYATQQFEYFFYFPASGEDAAQPHFPAHASVAGRPSGSARPQDIKVMRRLSRVDTASWEHVSQQATDDEVLTFLGRTNLARLDLEKVAWRSRKSAAFMGRLLALVRERHAWSEPNARYALVHDDAAVLGEWLRHRDDFIRRCGSWFSNALVVIDPVERRAFEHLEYSPWVNQRFHRFGAERQIPNGVLLDQYRHLLDILAHKPSLDAGDQLALVYFLFLQDRVEEALGRLDKVKPSDVPTRLQFDYLRCYAAFYQGKVSEARSMAAVHAEHPVDRWRKLFLEVIAQADEVEGRVVKRPGDDTDRERREAELAAREPSVDMLVEGGRVRITSRNVREVTLNYYLMDPEFLFSTSPFVASDPGRFSIVKPTLTTSHAVADGAPGVEVPLPERFVKANVLVEVVGGGRRKTQAYHANTFRLVVSEGHGRLELRDAKGDQPVPRAYVKAYARVAGGGVRFLKDGYTDLRGRFDYASLHETRATPVPVRSSGQGQAHGMDHPTLVSAELPSVEKIALLVLSESHGAAVREVSPPRR